LRTAIHLLLTYSLYRRIVLESLLKYVDRQDRQTDRRQTLDRFMTLTAYFADVIKIFFYQSNIEDGGCRKPLSRQKLSVHLSVCLFHLFHKIQASARSNMKKLVRNKSNAFCSVYVFSLCAASEVMGLLQLRYEHDSSTIRLQHATRFFVRSHTRSYTRISGRRVLHVD